MTVSGIWAGATSPSGFTVVAKTTATSARLGVSTSAAMTSPTYFGPVSPGSLDIAKVAATGLSADTDYWYAIEEDSVLDTANVGTVHTFPTAGSQASYRVAVSSCAGPSSSIHLTEVGISNSPAFDHIRDTDPLLFVHEGDMHYKNITANDVTLYREAFDAIWAASHQASLYKSCSLAYIPDDHDTGGNDTSGTTSASRPAGAQVYRERVPSYTIPAGPDAPVYQSWEIGRVLFIFSDTRWARSADSAPDNSSKTMLGATQKSWMAGILASSTAEALVWLNPTPWMGLATDTWAGFTTERAELRDLFVSTGWMDRMVIVNGDNHSNGMDTGGGNQIKTGATCPVWMWGSIDSPSSGSSTQYDMGPTSPGTDRYGTIDVVDDDGLTLSLIGTGYIGNDVWRQYTLEIQTAVATTPPQSLALLYDDILSRVRIQAHGLHVDTVTVDVERSANQITWDLVRGGLRLPVDSVTVSMVTDNSFGLDDYEFAPDEPNYYRVRMYDDTDTLVDTVIGLTTPTMDAVWLKSVSRPFLNTKVSVVDMGDVSRSTRSGVFPVAGARLPVVVSDLMTSRAFDLQVLTDDKTQADALDALLSLGEPLLVHVPQTCPIPIPTMYASVGDIGTARPGRLSPVKVTTLPLTEVAPPGPDVVGVTITWFGVMSTYSTWADLLVGKATWGDVLDSVGSPDDVVI